MDEDIISGCVKEAMCVCAVVGYYVYKHMDVCA